MNTKEIILSNSLEESDMCSVIEEYIKERKGVVVSINNLKGINVYSGIGQMMYRQRINMAFNAFAVAAAWLLKNKYNK